MTSSQGFVKFVIFVSWLLVTFPFSSAVEVSMKGNSYITYDLRSDSITTEADRITFSFKTIHPFGLFLHSAGSQGDLITIELIHGRIRLTMDLGSTKRTSVILGDNLSDNKWHEIKVHRNQKTVDLAIDKLKRQTTVPGDNVRLDLDTTLYVGGLEKTASDYDDSLTTPNFNGCMKNLFFNHKDIFHSVKVDQSDYNKHGNVRFNCSSVEYAPVNFPSPDSYLKVTSRSPKTFKVDLSFRTYEGDGVLVYKSNRVSKMYLMLISGNMELQIQMGSNPAIRINSVDETLNDGKWHTVIAGVTSKEIWFQLDKNAEVRHENPELSNIGDFRSGVFIGFGTQKTGFVGCMNRITINGSPVIWNTLKDSQKNGAVDNECRTSSKCFPSPCKNQGKCSQTWKSFKCNCKGTFYEGERCEVPLYSATCQGYKELGMTQDAYCKVDPDGTGPLGALDVLCNMTTSEQAMTVIKHDKEGKRDVTLGALSLPGHYFQFITYQSNMKSVLALIKRSVSCRQFISFQCQNSKLLNSPRGPEHVQWKSSNGSLQNNWGGAPSGSGKCACGKSNSCDDPSRYCNCDTDRKNGPREDYGYLTDKSLLPVTMIQFSEDAANSFFTLGPLECFGSSDQTSGQVTRASFVSSVCKLVNPPPTVDTTTATSVPITSPQRAVTNPRAKETSIATFTTTTGKFTNTELAKHHVTLTTTIATDKNSTLVTSVISHEAKNDGVTVHSSITTGKSGVTVHSSITTQGETVTLPPMTTARPGPPRVVVITNGSVSYVTHVEGGIEYDARFIILITSAVLAFILLIWLIIFVFLKRSGRNYVWCISCRSCARSKNIPDIEVYRHSIRTDSPDELTLDDMNHDSGEVGNYKITNGQTVYHSVRDSHVRKYVSFSASTSKL